MTVQELMDKLSKLNHHDDNVSIGLLDSNGESDAWIIVRHGGSTTGCVFPPVEIISND